MLYWAQIQKLPNDTSNGKIDIPPNDYTIVLEVGCGSIMTF